MAADGQAAAKTGAVAWWARAHHALLPDYNRKSALYWWFVVILGAGILVHALRAASALPTRELLLVVGGVAIAVIAALFPVRIPRSTNSFAAGEIFIFLLLLLQGPEAAALAAAGEGLVGALRTSRRWSSRIATPAIACVSMFISGSALKYGLDAAQVHGIQDAGLLLAATMGCAILYFFVTTVLVTAVPYLKRSEWPSPRSMFGNFGWIGLTFAGSASVACLLYLSFEQAGFSLLVAAVPIIAMLLTTLHTLFRQQEVDETVRQGRIEAAEREAALAARHMRELEVSERRFHRAFSHASIGMALVGFDGRVLQVNPALCALLELSDERDLLTRPFADVVAPEHAPVLNDRLMQLNAQQTNSFVVELRLHRRSGAEVWATVNGSFFAESDEAAPCLILQVQDVTARRDAEAGLQHLAFHDSLTGLPNRRRFQEQLAQALQRVHGDQRRHFALMFLDFDRFKVINDSLGHAVGDEFLVAVARRMQQQLRPHDIIARLGGDEFAILAEDLDDGRTGVTLAERLLEVLRQPIPLASTELITSASIGITFSSMGYTRAEDMLRDADTAMYKAKAGGKARFALFDSQLHTEVSQRMRIEGELRRALAGGGLSVAYQPIFEMKTGHVTGFEALARWTHAELGVIQPATFIPIAEDSGLIMPLTDFVLRCACRQLRDWQRRDMQFESLGMHVNVSGSDVAHPGLVERVSTALAEAQLDPQCLTLELTENILMERLEAALPTLEELRRLGVGLSIDDFGTGYTSLQHLSGLPVDSLKVDRAFVNGLHRGANEAAVVRAIVLLGDSLGKHIIAEGIETEAQLAQLQVLGCGTGQGYHLSRPLTPELVDVLLDKLVVASRPGGIAPELPRSLFH